jgi:hypothetical protein
MINIFATCRDETRRISATVLIIMIFATSCIGADAEDKFERMYRYDGGALNNNSVLQIDKDYELLQVICNGIDLFHQRIERLRNILNDEELFPPDLELELVDIWATYLRHRKVLLTIANRYLDKAETKDDLTFGPTVKQKEILLSYSSSLFLFSSTAKLTGMLIKPSNRIWKRLDEANPSLDIRPRELSSMWRTITSISAVRKMAEAKQAYFNAYPEAQNLTSAGIRPANWLHNRVLSEIAYLDTNAPLVWKEKLKQLWQSITTGLHKPYYSIFSAISIWVGDTKYVKRPPAIKEEQIKQMISFLQPGDILLERENWYLSNAFLPGFWPHGIVYTGTKDELIELGLHKDPRVARHLEAYGTADDRGHVNRVVESISEGVVMNTMEHATDADYVCAFRPRVSLKDRKEAIARAFDHIGRPYDFDFDFLSADKIVCTELVYRSYGHIIKFDVEHVAGKPVVQGKGIIRKYEREKNEDNKQLDFIFFLDSDSKNYTTWFSTDEELIKSNSRRGLAFLNRDDKSEQ